MAACEWRKTWQRAASSGPFRRSIYEQSAWCEPSMRVAVGCQVFLSCGGWLQFRFSTLVPRAGVLFPGSAGIVHEPRGLMILPDASFKLKTLFMRVTPRGSVDELFFFRYLPDFFVARANSRKLYKQRMSPEKADLRLLNPLRHRVSQARLKMHPRPCGRDPRLVLVALGTISRKLFRRCSSPGIKMPSGTSLWTRCGGGMRSRSPTPKIEGTRGLSRSLDRHPVILPGLALTGCKPPVEQRRAGRAMVGLLLA